MLPHTAAAPLVYLQRKRKGHVCRAKMSYDEMVLQHLFRKQKFRNEKLRHVRTQGCPRDSTKLCMNSETESWSLCNQRSCFRDLYMFGIKAFLTLYVLLGVTSALEA